MPLLIVTYAIQIACAVHAVRRGYPYMIIFMIVAFPFVGCAVYVIAVLLPEMAASRTAQKAKASVHNTVDPTRHLRRHYQDLEVADTIENKLKLADELSDLGRPKDAIPLYQACLEGVYADNPDIMLKLAKACYEIDDHAAARKTLEAIVERHPDYESDDGHLLYARCLQAAGEVDEAIREYRAVCDYFVGPEARCLFGQYLMKLGRDEEARAMFRDVIAGFKHVSPALKKRHAEWLRIAQDALRELS